MAVVVAGLVIAMATFGVCTATVGERGRGGYCNQSSDDHGRNLLHFWCSVLLACQRDIKVISRRMMLLPVREVANFRHFFDIQGKAAPVE